MGNGILHHSSKSKASSSWGGWRKWNLAHYLTIQNIIRHKYSLEMLPVPLETNRHVSQSAIDVVGWIILRLPLTQTHSNGKQGERWTNRPLNLLRRPGTFPVTPGYPSLKNGLECMRLLNGSTVYMTLCETRHIRQYEVYIHPYQEMLTYECSSLSVQFVFIWHFSLLFWQCLLTAWHFKCFCDQCTYIFCTKRFVCNFTVLSQLLNSF